MTRSRIALLGVAVIALTGAAVAQPYGSPYAEPRYDQPGPPDRVAYSDRTETVIVRPDYDDIQRRTVLGRAGGEINPTEYSLSRPVSLADLDLSRASDRQEARNRIYETAVNLCYELDDRMPSLRGDESGDRECVRSATRNAIRDVMDPRY